MSKFPRLITALSLLIMCSVCTTLSTINLDVGSRSSANPLYNLQCQKDFKCYWTTETPAGYLIKLRGTIYNILAGILASCLLVIGKMTGTPDYYLPWLFFSIKNMIFLQSPAICRFALSSKPFDTFFASAILLTSIFLYAEEWCLWISMFDSFRLLWKRRKNQRRQDKEGKKQLLPFSSRKQADFNDIKLQAGIFRMKFQPPS